VFVTRYMEAIPRGGVEAHEAALALGLMIERETVCRPSSDDDGGIRAILGDELADRRLSGPEVKEAVEALIKYVGETPEPHPTAVWALTKGYDERALPHFINILDRFSADPEKEKLAYQALVGLSSFRDDPSLSAVRRAADRGQGLVRETATLYLGLFSDE
jgi:HEAT repeat protein